MKSWEEQNAKRQFSKLLDEVLKNGPQLIMRHGVAIAVLLPIAEWKRMHQLSRAGLKALLLAPSMRVPALAVDRHNRRRRPPIDLK